MEDYLIHQIPQPIFIYNVANLKFLEVNKAAQELYGYTRDEFLNIDLTDLYTPEDIQTLIETSDKQTMTGVFTGPWRHKTKNGKLIYVDIGKSKIEFNGKKAHLNIINDVTEKIKQKVNSEFKEAVLEFSDQPILRIDPEGFILSTNLIFRQKMGAAENELEKRSILQIVDKNERDKAARLINKLKESEPIKTELSFVYNDKSLSKTEIKFIPLFNFDETINSHAVIVKPPQEIKIEKVEVPVEVPVEIPVEVPATVNKADVSSEQKVVKGLDSSFLSHLFHEILTPINVIIGFSQEIIESIEDPNEEQIEWKEIIDENQQMLLQILNIAAEYASVETVQAKLNPETFGFVDILKDVEKNIKKISKTKKVEFSYGKISSSLKIESDKAKFITFVSLLLQYAISLTESSKIYLSAYPVHDQEFILSIKDSHKSASENLIQKMNMIFFEDESIIRQKFGFSRFSIRLVQKLQTLLSANLLKEYTDLANDQFGLVFSQKFIEVSFDEEGEVEEEIVTEHEKEPVFEDTSENVEDKEVEEIEELPLDVEEKVVTPSDITSEEETEIMPEEKIQPEIFQKKEFDYSSLTCLYIEDQVDSQLLLKAQMRDLKEINFVTKFEDAIPLISEKKYDFIITDINLQGEYNGLDALRIIKKTPGYENTPVIAVTAYALPGDKDRFIKAGFFEFISKPLMKNNLLEILKHAFEN